MEVASSGISVPEKVFLQEGIAANCREDGRSNLELRPIRLQLGVIPTEFGSARVCNGESDVMVGVRAELVRPRLSSADAGEVVVNVSFSSPAEVDRKLAILGDDHLGYGLSLGTTLQSLLFSPEVFSRDALCVASGLYVWHLYIDLLVLSIGGSLVDLASLGIVAALRSARLPAVNIVADIGVEAVLTEELSTQTNADAIKIRIDANKPKTPIPNANSVPLLISIGIIGNSVVADLTQEESYAVSHVVYGAVLENEANYQIAGLLKSGGCPLPLQLLSSINLRLINIAKTIFQTFCAAETLASGPGLSVC